MTKIPFNIGDPVYYDGSDHAYINFVCNDYIVVCTHDWPDEGTLHGIKQVNVLVYRNDWVNIKPRISSNEKNNTEGSV